MNVLQGTQPLVLSGITQMQMVIEWPLQPSQSIYTQLLGVIVPIVSYISRFREMGNM